MTSSLAEPDIGQADLSGTLTLKQHDIRLDNLTAERLARMEQAGALAIECEDALAATQDNVVTDVLRHQGAFTEWQHYPKGDVFDRSSHAQFYYHAHTADERVDGEHGHFHTFIRGGGIPAGIKPATLPGIKKRTKRPAKPDDIICHVIGISMDVYGQAFRLFTTNRWVTGETWFHATDVISIADKFSIDHTQPSWPTNRWISAMVTVFRPQIDVLIDRRDAAMAAWAQKHPNKQQQKETIYDDRNLNVTSQMWISLDEQLDAIEAARAGKQ